MTLPKKLKAWRRRWSLDQRRAAVALGVTLRTLENWEQATSAPRGLAKESIHHKLQNPPEE
jgi:DNA-binding transcriptional regulator YiaG